MPAQTPDWIQAEEWPATREEIGAVRFWVSKDGGFAKLSVDERELAFDLRRPLSVQVSRARDRTPLWGIFPRSRAMLHVTLRQDERVTTLSAPVPEERDAELLDGLPWLEANGIEVKDPDELVRVLRAMLVITGEVARWAPEDTVDPALRREEMPKLPRVSSWPRTKALAISVFSRGLIAFLMLGVLDLLLVLKGGGLEVGDFSLVGTAAGWCLAFLLAKVTPGKDEVRLVERPAYILYPILPIFHAWFYALVGFASMDAGLLALALSPLFGMMALHFGATRVLQRINPDEPGAEPSLRIDLSRKIR